MCIIILKVSNVTSVRLHLNTSFEIANLLLQRSPILLILFFALCFIYHFSLSNTNMIYLFSMFVIYCLFSLLECELYEGSEFLTS